MTKINYMSVAYNQSSQKSAMNASMILENNYKKRTINRPTQFKL